MDQDRTLLAIRPDGTTSEVYLGYEGIKQGLDGGLLTFVRAHQDFAFYVDDEGMLKGLEFNLVASMMSGQALYGPAVLIAAEPNADGDTVPPSDEVRHNAEHVAQLWKSIVKDMRRKGQTGFPVANPDTIPPADIRSFGSWDEMQEYLFGEQMVEEHEDG